VDGLELGRVLGKGQGNVNGFSNVGGIYMEVQSTCMEVQESGLPSDLGLIPGMTKCSS
jgi:hypothetical protein